MQLKADFTTLKVIVAIRMLEIGVFPNSLMFEMSCLEIYYKINSSREEI